ncbi:MAG: Folylpolyglutamate synthase/dihydrofolate synthase [Thermotogales bacterium 46_20]|nr:MAG: Folylpolyglutamate synthase/dihydrofolate synthase [Thermotogales bacterium 46_20]
MDDYRTALDYLYKSRPYGKIKYGLYRIEELLDRLGNPQEKYPVIHIAGTNGKGSVASLLKSMAQSHGMKTGMNISPHVISFRERIQIDNDFIGEEDVCSILREIVPHLEKMDRKGEEYAPSFFEVVTAMTFLFFHRRNIDLAVVEAGLGGRLDASNVLKNPLATVITSVALDHMNILGSIEEQIAAEKCGIIKPLVPMISGVSRPCIRRQIKERAQALSSPVSFIDRDFGISGVDLRLNANRFDYWGEENITSLETSFNGIHQLRNCSIAINTFERSMTKIKRGLHKELVNKALKDVCWPGRFEILEYRSRKFILDGGHNPDAARNLRMTLETYFPGQSFDFIFGILDDKDFVAAIDVMAPIARDVYVSKIDNRRCVNPQRSYDYWVKWGKNVRLFDDSHKALLAALEKPEELPVVCWGSLYLVSELRAVMTGRYEYAGRH